MQQNFRFTAHHWRKLVAAEIDEGRYLEFKVVSNSMYPQIMINDIVLIEILDSLPKKGEVIVYHNNSSLIPLTVHRCIGFMQFRGDANLLQDKNVLEADLVGKVQYILRDGSKIPVLAACFSIKMTMRRIIYNIYNSLFKRR